MNKEYTYPLTGDPHFQSKIYKKREYHYHKIPYRQKYTKYKDIKKHRDKICGSGFSLFKHQAFLSNFINPDTPYKGLLIFHGVGTGKCLAKDELVKMGDNKLVKIQDIWKKYHSNTMIYDDDGIWSVPIKKIYVHSYDEKNDIIIKQPIKRLYKQCIYEKINVLKLINGQVIRLTKRHKLLTENGWSNNFILNKFVKTSDNKFTQIDCLVEEEYDGYVYDLEIEGYHNFVASGVIASNTCAAITIAETFKSMVQKYNTKIHVLVPGPIVKENWMNELVKCTGNTYMNYQDKSIILNKHEKLKEKKAGLDAALQYYTFMSYKKFYRKVLGEKILEKVKVNGKIKTIYRKNDKGEYERDLSIDRIDNLNNSLIIVDEAHHLTGNDYGVALKKIIDKSINLKILLLTATPMKNLADDIVPLLNFIRPKNDPILREKIFSSKQNYQMEFKNGGIDYLKEMTNGYVSYLRGADPLTFAKKIDKGVLLDSLLFTKVVQCKMLPFQLNAYVNAIGDETDTLDKKSESAANFVFPGLSQDRQEIVGYYGLKGIRTVKNQLVNYKNLLNDKIGTKLFDGESDNFLKIQNKMLTGKIMKLEYLKYFSIKFHTALSNLMKVVHGGEIGLGTVFVYANLVRVGINLFKEILLQNGYLEYQENYNDYDIKPTTLCYYCGNEHHTHENNNDHKFMPSVFLTVTGASGLPDDGEAIPEEKQKIINNVFNNINNRYGKIIKFILGSKVMSEGITLYNVREVHILDVHYNLGRVDQVIGRAIRHCKHYQITNEDNKNPQVNVYRYVVSLDKGLSTEEKLYKKGELKYLMIKKVERVLKEMAVDCPLNRHGNIFPEELEKYKNCIQNKTCPAVCDYMNCDYKCYDNKLNDIFDNKKLTYKDIPKNKIDKTTFNENLAKNDIDFIKTHIKTMYGLEHVYTLDEIEKHIKSIYIKTGKEDVYDKAFVYRALEQFIPITENDFNNFNDIIVDKLNNHGYIIHRGDYYIFQPFNQNENVPMYYRTTYSKQFTQKINLFRYMKTMDVYKLYKSKKDKKFKTIKNMNVYDFESVQDYYDKRKEYFIVGIIDKAIPRRQVDVTQNRKDVFKLRPKRLKKLDKKRGVGIPTYKGSVCGTTNSKAELLAMAKKIKVDMSKVERSQVGICRAIKHRLLFLEKYATDKNNNKMTYIIIPKNHQKYPFPYNLEDRINYLKKQIKNKIKFELKFKVEKKTNKKTKLPYYIVTIQNNNLNKFSKILEKYGGVQKNKKWSFLID